MLYILPAVAFGCTEYEGFEDHIAPEIEEMDVAVNGTEASVVCRLSSSSDKFTEYGFEYWTDGGERVRIGEPGSPGAEFSCVIKDLDYEMSYSVCAYVCRGARRYEFPEKTFSVGPDIIDDLFPDKVFLGECIACLDTDKDGHLSRSEADRAKKLDILTEVSSLEGIANLPALESFWLSYASVETADFSANTCLKSLKLTNNTYLKSITLPAGVSLSELRLSRNNLKELDLSMISSADVIDCQGNIHLAELSLPSSRKVRSLDCSACDVRDLDLSGFEELESLSCYRSDLTPFTVKLDGCISLKSLEMSGYADLRAIEALDSLESLSLCSIYENAYDVLDLSEMTGSLKKLKVLDVPFKEIVFTGCAALEDVILNYTEVSSLDLSECSSLKTLSCRYNGSLVQVTVPSGTSVDVERNVEVKYSER